MKNSTLLKKWLLLIAFGVLGFSYTSAAIQADTATILSEPFATSLGRFTQQSLVGAQVWTWSSSGGGYAKITGYVSSVQNANDDWLISPSINFANASNVLLNFTHVHRYGTDVAGTNTMKLYVTDSYISGAIDSTKWTELTFNHSVGTNWTFVNSGDINLSSYIGKRNVHFAFRYISDAVNSATWEIKNVSLRGLDREVILSENFDKFTAGSFGSPSSTNVGATINDFTQTAGWAGANVYAAGGAIKVGGSTSLGTITTKPTNLSQDNGKFFVSFYAARWSSDSSYVNILVNDVQAKVVTGVLPAMGWFGPIELTGGTAATTIKFAGAQASKGRFFLDSLIVTQQVPAVPSASLATTSFKTKIGTTQTLNLALTAKSLSGDLTVTLANKLGTDFSTTTTTITKATALAGGSTIPVKYNPLIAGADTATITISGGGLADNVVATIIGVGYATVPVANLGALREAYVSSSSDQTIVYEIAGELTVANVQSSGNSKWIQDATGGLLVYDVAGAIKTVFVAGNGMAGLTGTLTEYGKQLELIPLSDATVSTVSKDLFPAKLTIPQAKTQKERFESMYVYFENLTYLPAATPVLNWSAAKANYNFVNGTDTIVLRTNYTGMDYMLGGTTVIPTAATNFAGMLLEYNGTLQFYPRSLSDIGYSGTVLGLTETAVPASVWGSNGTLNVNTTVGQSIEVFNLMGQRLMKSTATEGINTFSLNRNQLYLVRVNNRVSKIVL